MSSFVREEEREVRENSPQIALLGSDNDLIRSSDESSVGSVSRSGGRRGRRSC